MNWLDKIILSVFPGWAARRAHARYVERQFTGADLDRLRTQPTYKSIGPIDENRRNRPTLLNTARSLDRNNSFAHGAFNALVNNVIGRGIKFESRVSTAGGRPIDSINRKIEREWKEWSSGVDINRQMHFLELQQIVERELWIAGEILIGKFIHNDKRRVPLALEVIESERLAPIDDETSENRIIQGVEYNKGGQIIAYHIYPNHPSDNLISSDPVRVKAQNILHLFHATRPNQVRGISRVAPVARNFEALNQYMDHELTRARVHSSFALMIKRGGVRYATKFPSSGDTSATYDSNDYPTDSAGNPMAYMEGGMIFQGGPNDSIEGTGPAISTSGFKEFVSTNLRAIATGLNMSYELLARDFTQTNFSSARQSSLEDKRHWEPRQEFIINHLCNPVFGWFIDVAVVAGVQPFLANLSRLETDWITPPREYIDPVKEVTADIKAIEAGFTTLQKVCSKHGTDPHENMKLNSQILKEAKNNEIELLSIKGKQDENQGTRTAGRPALSFNG